AAQLGPDPAGQGGALAERGGGDGHGAKADTEPVAGAFTVDQAASLERGEQPPGGRPLESAGSRQFGQAGRSAEDGELPEQSDGPGDGLHWRPRPPTTGDPGHGQSIPTMKPSSVLSNSSRAAVTSTMQAASRRLVSSGPAAKSGAEAKNACSRSIVR